MSHNSDSYGICLPISLTTGAFVPPRLNSRDCENNGNKTDQIELNSHCSASRIGRQGQGKV